MTKRASAARAGGREEVAEGGEIHDPTARILDQYRAEYEAFEQHLYAELPRKKRFGRSTAALPFRGEPEASGDAFNPLKTLDWRR
ncbi:MAG: hypothetical protein ACXW31_12760 [Thermoanaerobaculia bacterium]